MKKLIRVVLSMLVVLTLDAACAGTPTPLERDLWRYFPVREALARDDLPAAQQRAKELARTEDKALARSAEELVKAADLVGARAAFGGLSKALASRVEESKKKGEWTGEVFVFRCPMAKPEGTWLQERTEIGNPYFGKSMSKCGKLIETIPG